MTPSLMLLAATTLLAQVRESITVEVIDVPVYVVDADGRAVRGLARDAFTLRIDGKPHPIEYFDVLDFGATEPKKAAVSSQRERRLYLLLFDLTFAVPDRVAKAQAAAEKAIDQSNPATDLFSVATYSSIHGVTFVTPFLYDRVAIRRALHTLKGSTARDSLALTITKDEREAWKDLTGGGDAAGASQGDTAADAELIETLRGGAANQEMAGATTARLIEDEFDGIGEAAERLRTLEGQKHVLLFTQGYDSKLVHGFTKGPGPPRLDARLLRKLDEMHRRFRSAGVILDSVDVAGLRHTFDSGENEALWMLARGTGGQVVHNKNDLTAAIADLTATQQVVYLLGFRRTDARAHSIDVRVEGAAHGSNIYFRTGFGQPQKSTIDALQLADIVINDVPQSGVSIDLDVVPGAGSAAVELRLHRAEILPQLLEKTPYVDLMLYIFTHSGESAASASIRIPFDPHDSKRGDLPIRKGFNLPPGQYIVKALVRIDGTTSMGFARKEFAVP